MFSRLYKHKEILFILFIALLYASRCFRLNGGVILGEPDEFNLARVAQNFDKSLWPTYEGEAWFFELPLFPLLGFAAGKLIGGYFLPLRTVSLLASFGTAVFLFFFLRRKTSFNLSVFGVLVFSFIPFSVFYSRIGILEATWVFFVAASYFLLDSAIEKESKMRGLAAGLLLGFSLMTKYSAFLFFLLFGFLFLGRSVCFTVRSRFKEVRADLISGLAILPSLLMIIPLMFVFRKHDYIRFVDQTKHSLGMVGGGQWSLLDLQRNFRFLLRNFSWWFSPLVGFLAFAGFWRKKMLGLKFLSVLVLVVVLMKVPLYPRYFCVLVPFLACLATSGLGAVLDKFGGRFAFFGGLLALSSCLSVYPEAFNASYHTLIGDSADYIRERSASKPAAFSNYWPNYLCLGRDFKYCTWFSLARTDFAAFYPNEEGLTIEDVLGNENLWLVMEDCYSATIITPNEGRKRAYQKYLRGVEPVGILIDRSPNFPFFRGLNRVEIYQF